MKDLISVEKIYLAEEIKYKGYITLSVENKKRDVKNHLSL